MSATKKNKKGDPQAGANQQALEQTVTAVKAITATMTKLGEDMKALKAPQYGAGRAPGELFGDRAPHVTSGKLGEKGYSILKMAAVAMGVIDPDQAKEEIDVSNKLRALYKRHGHGFHTANERKSWIVPFATRHMPVDDPEGEKLAGEIRQKMHATWANADPEEMTWLAKRMGYEKKALSTFSETAAGVLVGFPTLGELIDLQRNREAFANAGASEIGLPPNGRIQFPKLTGGATAAMIGEAATITDSQPSTGYLNLVAKKMGIFVKMTNELLRFAGPSSEALVRMDMARVGALLMDLQMLEGNGGGNQVMGIINYPITGNDPLTIHTPTDVPGGGNEGYDFFPEDAFIMESELPDAVDAPTAWIMRKGLWGFVANRRADAVSAADAKGPFVFNITREAGDKQAFTLNGTSVVRSNQVSNTRVRGTAVNLTYVLLGFFPDWVIARSGVVEFLANDLADSAFTADMTFLRAIQMFDAGARHARSFNLFDQVKVA